MSEQTTRHDTILEQKHSSLEKVIRDEFGQLSSEELFSHFDKNIQRTGSCSGLALELRKTDGESSTFSTALQEKWSDARGFLDIPRKCDTEFYSKEELQLFFGKSISADELEHLWIFINTGIDLNRIQQNSLKSVATELLETFRFSNDFEQENEGAIVEMMQELKKLFFTDAELLFLFIKLVKDAQGTSKSIGLFNALLFEQRVITIFISRLRSLHAKSKSVALLEKILAEENISSLTKDVCTTMTRKSSSFYEEVDRPIDLIDISKNFRERHEAITMATHACQVKSIMLATFSEAFPEIKQKKHFKIKCIPSDFTHGSVSSSEQEIELAVSQSSSDASLTFDQRIPSYQRDHMRRIIAEVLTLGHEYAHLIFDTISNRKQHFGLPNSLHSMISEGFAILFETIYAAKIIHHDTGVKVNNTDVADIQHQYLGHHASTISQFQNKRIPQLHSEQPESTYSKHYNLGARLFFRLYTTDERITLASGEEVQMVPYTVKNVLDFSESLATIAKEDTARFDQELVSQIYTDEVSLQEIYNRIVSLYSTP